MAAVDRETATGIIRESLSAYRKKVIDSSKLKKELYPEGRELIDDLYNNRDGIIFIFADAIGNPNFFNGIDDEGLLEYVRLCQQIMKAIGESYDNYGEGNERIEKILDDKDENKKGIWETVWGALQGEFNENPSGSEILIDMGLNFIPFVGQACDARDIAACLKKLIVERRANEIAIWVTLLLTAIGCVPYAGDIVKAGCKAILKGADDVVLAVLKKLDAENVYRAFRMFRAKFVSSLDNAIEMVCRWIEEARKSKYGSKVDSVLVSARENLCKAVDFVKEQIDEFGERIFKKERKEIIIETSGTKGNWNQILNKKLEPNKIYKVDGYSYFTDNSGRVTKVSGELKLETKDRNVYQQGKAVEIKDGIAGEDQGGHIIARIFNGPGEQINYVPQSATLNNGEWRDMERTWQNALSEGKRVDINIEIVYNKSSKRPENFNVTYYINGKLNTKQFDN